jgi:hypothetical protein
LQVTLDQIEGSKKEMRAEKIYLTPWFQKSEQGDSLCQKALWTVELFLFQRTQLIDGARKMSLAQKNWTFRTYFAYWVGWNP